MSSVLTTAGAGLAAGALPYVVWRFSGVRDRASSSLALTGALFAVLVALVAPAILLATLDQAVDPVADRSVNKTNATDYADAFFAEDDVERKGAVVELLRALTSAAGIVGASLLSLWYTGAVTIGALPKGASGSSSASQVGLVEALTSVTGTISAKVIAIACGWAAAEVVLIRLPYLWNVASAEDLSAAQQLNAVAVAALSANAEFVLVLGTLAAVWLAAVKPLRGATRSNTVRTAAAETGTGKVSAAQSDWLENTAGAKVNKKKGGAKKRSGRKGDSNTAGGSVAGGAASANAATSENLNAEAISAWVIASGLALLPSIWRFVGIGADRNIVAASIRAVSYVLAAVAVWIVFARNAHGARR